MKETRIDTQLFIDIIEAEDDVFFDFEDSVGDSTFRYYRGKKGTICVCITDEFLTNRIAKSLMKQLGLDYLIVNLFPGDYEQDPIK